MANKNYEIENALQIIELLEKYIHAENEPEQNEILQKLRNTNRDAYKLITKQNYNPKALITKLKKAIKLDEYRPKNLSIISFAVNEDLDYTHGDFDTFDPKLSHMFKNNAAPDTIRERFEQGIKNINLLAKQFT